MKGSLEGRKRDYRMDNIRFLLIFLVVFGHFLELIKGKNSSNLYRVIYSFHMPAFLFLTGYFARYNRRKMVFSLLCPYLLFQTLYLWFDAVILNERAVKLQFTKPYWLLWYLMAVFIYHLLIPLLERGDARENAAGFVVLVSISLLAGFDASVGYSLALSRTLCFAPFFYAGYFAAQGGRGKDFLWERGTRNRVLKAGSAAAVLFAGGYIWRHQEITRRILYGSCSYGMAKYGPGMRFLLLLIAACWIVFWLVWISDKKLPFLSEIGRNTFPIFLLHGFFLRLAKKKGIFGGTEESNLLLAAGLTVLCLILLGNPWVAAGFRMAFGGGNRKKAVRKSRKDGFPPAVVPEGNEENKRK